MCISDAVVVSWFVIHYVPGLIPFTVMKNIFITGYAELSQNIDRTLKYLLAGACLVSQQPLANISSFLRGTS